MNRPKLARRLRRTAAAVVAVMLPNLSGNEPAPTGETVQLPPFVVEHGEKREWLLVEAEGLELLTTAPADEAVELATKFLQQRHLLNQFIPARFRWQSSEPHRWIVHQQSRRQIESHRLFEQLAGKNATLRELEKSGATFPPNLYLADGDSAMVFGFSESHRSRMTHTIGKFRDQGVALTPENIERMLEQNFRFTLERVVWQLQHRTPPLPAWLVTGLAGVYRQAAIDTDQMQLNAVRWQSPEVSEQLRLHPWRPRELLPAHRMFDDPPAKADPLWIAQCQLLVHWALLADGGRHRPGLWALVDDLAAQPLSEALVRRHWGFGYADLRDHLSDHLPAAVAWSEIAAEATSAPISPLTANRAPPARRAVILAEWERLQVDYVRERRPELLELYLNKARATVAADLAATDHDPALSLVAGLIEFEAGNPEAARSLLERGVAGGAGRPAAFYALARLRYDEAADATGAPLGAAIMGPVIAPLRRALESTPPLPDVFALWAELWLRAERAPTATELALLDRGAQHFPTSPKILARTALLHANHGRLQRAIAVLDYGLRHTTPGSEFDLYSRMHQELSSLLNQSSTVSQ